MSYSREVVNAEPDGVRRGAADEDVSSCGLRTASARTCCLCAPLRKGPSLDKPLCPSVTQSSFQSSPFLAPSSDPPLRTSTAIWPRTRVPAAANLCANGGVVRSLRRFPGRARAELLDAQTRPRCCRCCSFLELLVSAQ